MARTTRTRRKRTVWLCYLHSSIRFAYAMLPGYLTQEQARQRAARWLTRHWAGAHVNMVESCYCPVDVLFDAHPSLFDLRGKEGLS